MKHTSKFIILFFLALYCYSVSGQKNNKKNTSNTENNKDTIKKKVVIVPHVYLGHSDFDGGKIKKQKFDSLMKQGISSHDSLGKEYKIIGFTFNYAEKNIYEDVNANLVVMVDYSLEYCKGDTLSSTISNSLYSRTKPGDTIYLDHIMVLKHKGETTEYQPDSTAILGKNLVCIITK